MTFHVPYLLRKVTDEYIKANSSTVTQSLLRCGKILSTQSLIYTLSVSVLLPLMSFSFNKPSSFPCSHVDTPLFSTYSDLCPILPRAFKFSPIPNKSPSLSLCLFLSLPFVPHTILRYFRVRVALKQAFDLHIPGLDYTLRSLKDCYLSPRFNLV